MGKLPSVLFAFVLMLSSAAFSQTPSKEASATIAGVVTLNGEPMRNVTVTIQPMNSPGSSQRIQPRAKTDANGRFRITGVAAGYYNLGALAAAYVKDGSPSFGLGIGGFAGQTITIANGETIENLEIKLKRGGVITGRVTDADGEPVIETQVRLIPVIGRNPVAAGNPASPPLPPPPPMNIANSRTDDRGIYRIFGLPAGKYKVSVGLPVRQGSFGMQTSRSYIPETFHPDTTNEAEAKIIEVGEGDEVTDVDIKTAEAEQAYEISGRVVDAESGQPVSGIGLAFGTLDETGRLTGSMSAGWRTDETGEFQILGARPGKHAVFIENRDGKSDVYSEPTPVEVFNGDVSGVEIRARRGASISGTVIIEGANNPARSQITLTAATEISSGYFDSRYTKISSDGRFRINGLPAGKTRLAGYTGTSQQSLLRVEQNGVPLKGGLIELRAGEQINNIRFVFAYANADIRGQVKIIGGDLPAGIKLYVSLERSDGMGGYRPMTPLDDRGQFFVKSLMPGEYELRLSSSFSGGQPPREVISKIFPRLANAKQIVTLTNGIETQAIITIDLSQE